VSLNAETRVTLIARIPCPSCQFSGVIILTREDRGGGPGGYLLVHVCMLTGGSRWSRSLMNTRNRRERQSEEEERVLILNCSKQCDGDEDEFLPR
jgi:hypothetical protein